MEINNFLLLKFLLFVNVKILFFDFFYVEKYFVSMHMLASLVLNTRVNPSILLTIKFLFYFSSFLKKQSYFNNFGI